MRMDTWKPDEKVEITSIFFKQIDRINMIMSERGFDIMQLAHAVDALECCTYFLKARKNKSKGKKYKPISKEDSTVAKVRNKTLQRNEMYEFIREKINEVMILLDNNDMLISTIFEGEA